MPSDDSSPTWFEDDSTNSVEFSKEGGSGRSKAAELTDVEQENRRIILGHAIGMELDTEERPYGQIQVQNGNVTAWVVQQKCSTLFTTFGLQSHATKDQASNVILSTRR